MALSERLRRSTPRAIPTPLEQVRRRRNGRTDPFQELKTRIHRRLIERLDLANLEKFEKSEVRRQVRRVTDALLTMESTPLARADRERLIDEIENETFGLGPLEPLIQDQEIADILVNGPHQIYVERYGRLEETDVVFKDDAHLRQIIDRIVSKVGRRIDESSPMVDARLADGSRVNAIIPPLALDGPTLSIRRFGVEALHMEDLIELGTLPAEVAKLLEGCVKARLNLLISGGTGAGKTTLLNVLSSYIPPEERILTIEDSAELQLQQAHVVRLETRPPNLEGKGEVTQRMLVRNGLRMRPDRIIVGEVRGDEALDMLQAMNTGHDGSITTLHANSPRDALSRLETMVLMAGFDLPSRAIREQIVSAIQGVIQIARLPDGLRKIVSISEITGMEGDVVVMQDLCVFERTGISVEGEVLGRYRSTGIRPGFADRIALSGYSLPQGIFEHVVFDTRRAR
ncbi:MAG: CpaF family protein [Candidatus Eiseniibacteriota bacterium]|jgi:pilus assembly protein CpaF